jgi:Ca-activated chloride channel family protein
MQTFCREIVGAPPALINGLFMKRIRYSKYVPDPAGEMSMEDLLSALSDYLLQSGFQNYMFYDMEGEQTLDDLRRAIEQALLDGNLLDEEMQERLRQMQMDGTLDELIEQLIERMEQEDYISVDQPTTLRGSQCWRPTGSRGPAGQI